MMATNTKNGISWPKSKFCCSCQNYLYTNPFKKGTNPTLPVYSPIATYLEIMFPYWHATMVNGEKTGYISIWPNQFQMTTLFAQAEIKNNN